MDQPRLLVVGTLGPAEDADDFEEALRRGYELREDGADVIDLDLLDPDRFADDDSLALLLRGLVGLGAQVSVTTTSAERAALAADHGVAIISDPSGGSADPRMPELLGRLSCRCIVGPWAPETPSPGLDDAAAADAYALGLLRNTAELLGAGVGRERILVNATAGLGPGDPEAWRILNHLDRVAELGYPMLVDSSPGLLGTMIDDPSEQQLEDAALAVTVLAAGAGAWGVRVRSVSRVLGALQRISEPPPAL